ncbi:MAG: FHA domain-containing protein [Polyangia bacterium]|jgi:hypothetical protein|nr:FHA domain-containing protein [Polyangia bacterium]
MDLLAKLKEQALLRSLPAFAQANPGLYLYGRMPSAEALGFKTRLASPQGLRDFDATRTAGAGQLFLFRVEKSSRNSWARQISVGRATNNDIVLRHASVSKLHAHFFVRQQGGAEALMLADDGSSNGTAVNGRVLGEGDQAAVVSSPGDRLRFGDVEVTLLDPAGLHRELRRRRVVESDF